MVIDLVLSLENMGEVSRGFVAVLLFLVGGRKIVDEDNNEVVLVVKEKRVYHD